MTQIQVINEVRQSAGYVEVTYKMWFILPAIFGTGASPIKGLSTILSSYPDGFLSEIVAPDGTLITFTETKPLPIPTPNLAQIKNNLQARYTQIRTKLDSLTLTPYDTIAGLSFDGTNWNTST